MQEGQWFGACRKLCLDAASCRLEMHAQIPVETPHRIDGGTKNLTAPNTYLKLFDQPPTSTTLDRHGLMSHLLQQKQ